LQCWRDFTLILQNSSLSKQPESVRPGELFALVSVLISMMQNH
jgi:hypothetical protein